MKVYHANTNQLECTVSIDIKPKYKPILRYMAAM